MMPNLGEPSPPNSNSAEPLVSKNVITKSPMMSDSSVCDQNGVEPPAVAVEADHENVEYDPNHPGCGSSSNITLLESNVTPDKHRKAGHPPHRMLSNNTDHATLQQSTAHSKFRKGN